MRHLKRKKEDKTDSSSSIGLLPDFGPLNITDYKAFLTKSKEDFIEKWKILTTLDQPKESPSSENLPKLEDYQKLKLLGVGSFGRVYLVQNKQSNKLLAMKAIGKDRILKYKQIEHTRTERLVLSSINCPFTIRLEQYFIDNSYVYFIVPFAQGGELYYHLQKCGKFDEIQAMFYVAQVILAVEYLHFIDIVYRDLKPENILIDHTGYIKLADFGFCKRLLKGRTYTLCGTPEYLAPEVILSKGYGMSVDWWGVGILTYELVCGFTPFKEKKAIKVYEKVLRGVYKMPTYFSLDLKDLIRNILQADISKRYGNLKSGTEDFKNHKWFRPLNWQSVINRKFVPSYAPDCVNPEDTQHFRSYPYESLAISSTNKFSKEFENF